MKKERFDIPVVLFVFRRLDTVKLIMEKIQQIEPKVFYIFSDGARENVEGEKVKVQNVRDYISKSITWECDAKVIFHEKNKGCAPNICQGLDYVFEREPYAVIFEDDAVPKLDFFFFCQYLLKKYEDNDIQFIAGFNAIGKSKVFLTDYAFSKSAPMSGAIATWAKRWNECDFAMKSWPKKKKMKEFKKIFYSKEMYHIQYKALEDSYHNINDGWDYQFHYDMLDQGRYAIVPRENLARSYGYTEGAFHPQSRRQAKNLKHIMDYGDFVFSMPMNEPEKIELCAEYDEMRQKKLLQVNGNFLQRHLQYIRIKIKELLYKYLPRTVWNKMRHVIKNRA